MGEITEIKDEIKEKIVPQPTYSQQLYEYSQTPYPSWIFSSLLLSTPLILKQPVATTIPTNKATGFFKGSQKIRIGPSPLNALLFSSAFALGGWIIFDGDVESGSGFVTAWSSLYLIVNGRSALAGLKYGKPLPLLLTAIAAENAFIHGKRFFYTTTD